jgi:mono/diheme cytochrome c family protein
MNANFWREIHGGSTHFPIVLLLASVVFDFVAWRSRDEALRRGLHAAGYGSAIVGLLGAVGAATAGLVMTRGRMLGGGYERTHHLFVWPAVISSALLVAWRLLQNGRMPGRGPGTYLAGMTVAAALMIGAGYSGGRMLLGAESHNASVSPTSEKPGSLSTQLASISAGQQLFLKNCAHCHGADAHGDDGPDLHNLDWTDQQIATRIRNGKKGQMTAFAGKFSEENIKDVIAYLRTLN